MSELNDHANDYVLAKYLNERVVVIFAMVADYHNNELPDLTDINRSYVLLVMELKKLYARSPLLNDIKDNICWRTFDTIDAIDPHDLYEYSDDYRNHAVQHISQVNKLCIASGNSTPLISPALGVMLEDAEKSVTTFAEQWLIPIYSFEITEAGVLLVNGIRGVMNVEKVQAGSATEMILTQAKERPNETFKPDLKGHSSKRGIRTTLIEVGFSGALEKLFLPVMDNQRGVKFRPQVSRVEANKERIDLTELDSKLKRLGTATIFDTYSLLS